MVYHFQILRAEEKQYAETKKNLRAQIRDIRKTVIVRIEREIGGG